MNTIDFFLETNFFIGTKYSPTREIVDFGEFSVIEKLTTEDEVRITSIDMFKYKFLENLGVKVCDLEIKDSNVNELNLYSKYISFTCELLHPSNVADLGSDFLKSIFAELRSDISVEIIKKKGELQSKFQHIVELNKVDFDDYKPNKSEIEILNAIIESFEALEVSMINQKPEQFRFDLHSGQFARKSCGKLLCIDLVCELLFDI